MCKFYMHYKEMRELCIGLRVKYRHSWHTFNERCIFTTDFWKTHRYQILLKSFVQCGRTDRQTYKMKLIADLAILRTRNKTTANDAPVLRWIKSRGFGSVYLILKFSKPLTKALWLTHWKLHDMKQCKEKGERGPGLLDHYLFQYITRQ